MHITYPKLFFIQSSFLSQYSGFLMPKVEKNQVIPRWVYWNMGFIILLYWFYRKKMHAISNGQQITESRAQKAWKCCCVSFLSLMELWMQQLQISRDSLSENCEIFLKSMPIIINGCKTEISSLICSYWHILFFANSLIIGEKKW